MRLMFILTVPLQRERERERKSLMLSKREGTLYVAVKGFGIVAVTATWKGFVSGASAAHFDRL